MKYTRITTWFLAISLLMFGVLKFVNPFKEWYRIQIETSNLGQISYVAGILGEIFVGLLLVFCLLSKHKISSQVYKSLSNFAFFAIMVMMAVSIYVHLHPQVPADVLPLKIKPPYIPVFFLLLALYNSIASFRRVHADESEKKSDA